MSEHAPKHEHQEKFTVTPEQQREAQEKLNELIERGHEAKNEYAEHISALRAEALESAKEKDEVLSGFHKHEKEPQDMGLISQELKTTAYERTLTRVRKDLSLPGRVFSKVVHNPVIDSVSELGAKTVARPSGLLAGSILAFLGSSAFLWVAKHYGYEYNFLLFALFFLGGFAAGLALELLYRLLNRASRNR